MGNEELRARIEALAANWRKRARLLIESQETVYLQCADELDALLRLPAGEGEA